MRIAVLGAGAVGARVVRQLVATPSVKRVLVADDDEDRARLVTESMADAARVRKRSAGDAWWKGADVAVLATPAGDHGPVAERLLVDGVSVVSVSADVTDARALLDLDGRARERECTVVVGAGFSPGLTCLLSTQGAWSLDAVDEVHVARSGRGGPACAADGLRAQRGEVVEWRDGQWTGRPAGGGRELCWFPDPVGALECYPVATGESLVLVPAFPGVRRVTSRSASGRWDRVAPRLATLRRHRGEGQLGAVRVEMRGRRGGAQHNVVLGAVDRPAVAAGAVAAVAALEVAGSRLARHGAGGLAELAPASGLLTDLARRGVKVAVFDPPGAASVSSRESV